MNTESLIDDAFPRFVIVRVESTSFYAPAFYDHTLRYSFAKRRILHEKSENMIINPRE